MGFIVGMALFTQYYYKFPMIHFINLPVLACILYSVHSNLKIYTNYKIHSKAKPCVFGQTSEVKLQEKIVAPKSSSC